MTRRIGAPGPGESEREWGLYWRREEARERAGSRRAARQAGQWYKAAANSRVHAAWLTRRGPELWGDPGWHGGTPAETEAYAATLARVADSELRQVFRKADNARRYAGYARDAERRWAELLARVAAWEAEKAAAGQEGQS